MQARLVRRTFCWFEPIDSHSRLRTPMLSSFRAALVDFCRLASVPVRENTELHTLTVGEESKAALEKKNIKLVQCKPVTLKLSDNVKLAHAVDGWTAELGTLGIYVLCIARPGDMHWSLTLALTRS